MKKKEILYRLLLYKAMEKKQERFTQAGLSQELKISLSTTNNAVKPLERIGAIQIMRMGFRITDMQKLFSFFSSARKLQKDVIYSTRAQIPVSQIEKSMPAGVIFGAYSAYKFRFGDVPADYGEVYVYADENALGQIISRFPKERGPANLFVLKKDEFLDYVCEKNTAPLCQIYCDLWNLGQWYAKDFLKALEVRFGW